MRLEDAIADYLAYLRNEQGAFTTTLRTYQNGLRLFLKWLIANNHPAPPLFDFTTSILRAYHYANLLEDREHSGRRVGFRLEDRSRHSR